ncbi:MAG: CBS and ACT domain-containing protein [Thermodesulfobacteriota bacterium]|nr:CBS and ACT domain-containing protein [Thermodesulfobacteriota bacterium]
MIVKDIISNKLITINSGDNIKKAFELMKTNKIRHIPVLDAEKLVGIVTNTDLRQVLVPSESNNKKEVFLFTSKFFTVDQIMTKDPITVTPQTDIEKAAMLLQRNKIGGLPVIENDRLVGMITETDIFGVFIEIMGVIKYSSRVDVVLGEDPEAFQHVSKLIKENGADIISVGMSSSKEKGKRVYYFRLDTDDIDHIAESIEDKGYKVQSVVAG